MPENVEVETLNHFPFLCEIGLKIGLYISVEVAAQAFMQKFRCVVNGDTFAIRGDHIVDGTYYVIGLEFGVA